MPTLSEHIVTFTHKYVPATSGAILTATSIIIFAPTALATVLGVDQFRMENRGVLGWAFILSFSYLLVALIVKGTKHIRNLRLNRKKVQARTRLLHELSDIEKGYVAAIYQNNTITVDVSDGGIGGLVAKGIVFRSSNMFDMAEGIPYNLQPWVIQQIRDDPAILDGAALYRKQ